VTLVEALAALEAAGRIRSRWLPGMMDSSGDRVLAVGGSGVTIDRIVRDGHDHEREGAADMFPPDPYDPLTTMGMLLLAREAMGDPLLVTAPFRADNSRVLWMTQSWSARYSDNAPTERAAIEAAIIATAERLS